MKTSNIIGAVLVLAAGSVASAQTINYANFGDIGSLANLQFNGSANVGNGVGDENPTLQLTNPSSTGQAGAVWFKTKQNVGEGFDTTFRFRVRDRGNLPAADGIALVIQNTGLDALGSSGGGMGFGVNPIFGGNGIRNSVAIALDTFNNTGPGFTQAGNANSIQVQSKGLAANVPTADGNLGFANQGESFADGSVKTVRVQYIKGAGLNIFYQNLATPALFVPINLSSQLSLSGITSYIGFTGGTGGAPQRQEIIDWSFTGQIPAPATASLLGLGALAAGRRRRSN